MTYAYRYGDRDERREWGGRLLSLAVTRGRSSRSGAGRLDSPARRARPAWLRYGAAVLAVGLALLLKLLLDPLIEEESPFLLFFGAVMVGALFGGLGPGLLATALAALAADFFFLAPTYTLLVASSGHLLRLALFAIEGVFISALVETVRSASHSAEVSALRSREDREKLSRSEERFVTERRRSEEALREAGEKHRSIFENAVDGIFQTSPDGRLLTANPAMARILGYESPEELMANVSDVAGQLYVEPERRAEFGRILRERGAVTGFEVRVYRKDGSTAWVSAAARAVRDAGGGVVHYEGILEDISGRKRAEEALSEVREAERRRISADLHDEVLQDLIFALQETQVARLTGEPDLEEIEDALGRSVEGLRAAIFDLRLEELLERSFVSSVEAVVELNRRMARKRCEIHLEIGEGIPDSLPPQLGKELVRVVGEALSNARRHSGAGNVWVVLSMDGDRVCAGVADDGRGFDPGSVRGGVGLVGMRGRARSLGGDVEVESELGAGTVVRFCGPVYQATKE